MQWFHHSEFIYVKYILKRNWHNSTDWEMAESCNHMYVSWFVFNFHMYDISLCKMILINALGCIKHFVIKLLWVCIVCVYISWFLFGSFWKYLLCVLESSVNTFSVMFLIKAFRWLKIIIYFLSLPDHHLLYNTPESFKRHFLVSFLI